MLKRIDILLVEKKIVSSREKAKELIISKKVIIDNKFVLKSSTMVNSNSNISIINDKNKFVSRAGQKLEKAILNFKLNINNLIALDIGASTGGFTDCLLQNNAKLVYALDVGTNQLNWELRKNDKVISIEKTNFRNINENFFKHRIDFICCDVSFISLDKIIPNIKKVLKKYGDAVLLIKPQFETSRDKVKNGKITSKKIHKEVINKIIKICLKYSFSILNLDYSPITGNKKNNIEFIIHITNDNIKNNNINDNLIEQIINNAWKNL